MGVWEYFTPEQQAKMMKNMEKITPEERKAIGKESSEILSKLRLRFEQGAPPENDEIVSLAKRLEELQSLFNDNDPEIEQAIERFHIENPTQLDHGMIDLKLYRYIQQAKSCV